MVHRIRGVGGVSGLRRESVNEQMTGKRLFRVYRVHKVCMAYKRNLRLQDSDERLMVLQDFESRVDAV